jgi:hypothetical protein
MKKLEITNTAICKKAGAAQQIGFSTGSIPDTSTNTSLLTNSCIATTGKYHQRYYTKLALETR